MFIQILSKYGTITDRNDFLTLLLSLVSPLSAQPPMKRLSTALISSTIRSQYLSQYVRK